MRKCTYWVYVGNQHTGHEFHEILYDIKHFLTVFKGEIVFIDLNPQFDDDKLHMHFFKEVADLFGSLLYTKWNKSLYAFKRQSISRVIQKGRRVIATFQNHKKLPFRVLPGVRRIRMQASTLSGLKVGYLDIYVVLTHTDSLAGTMHSDVQSKPFPSV